jgi:hypothetical protein
MNRYFKISIIAAICVSAISCSAPHTNWSKKVEATLHDLIMQRADWALQQEPQTVTAFSSERSAGGIHDFFSEGDFWWPNPDNPGGPYIQRDGQSNPDNFVAHRLVMIRLGDIIGALASAYIVTGDDKYVQHAFRHLNAWFVNPATMMAPHLLYAQAIHGITTGRDIGIIDTVHLMEVAQGVIVMQDSETVDSKELAIIKQWFADYLVWLTTHQHGIDEMNRHNNHATCWVMQVASFATLTGNEDILEFCRRRYKDVLLPSQMAEDGSFPREISRTKAYGYSLFNLDAMTAICHILSTEEDNLWEYTTETGLNIKKGIEFMYPFIKDKSLWELPPDIAYWDEWPVAHPALLFGAIAFNNEAYFDLWKGLEHNPSVQEVVRNLPIRNPLIWLKR